MKKTPILYVGAPGIGKTAIVRSKYQHCEVLLLSSQNEEDIAGLPYREGNKEKRTIPQFIERIQKAHSEGKTTCLFLDELDKARREVADTLLTLITHPEHFGLPEETDIVSACNPPEWGGGDGISQPMMSRFSIIEFTPDINEWSKYMLNRFQDPQVREIVSLFTTGEIPLLENVGEGYQWRLTCPRTIEMAMNVLVSDLPDKEKKIQGLLTPNVSSRIISFLKNDDILSDTQKISRSIGNKKVINKILRI